MAKPASSMMEDSFKQVVERIETFKLHLEAAEKGGDAAKIKKCGGLSEDTTTPLHDAAHEACQLVPDLRDPCGRHRCQGRRL